MTAKITAPFGLWQSPVTAASTSQRLRLEDVQWDANGALLWLEGHSDQNRIISRLPTGKTLELTGTLSARGRVGYGGGDFTVQDGLVVFAGADGRLYSTRTEGGEPRPVTPAGLASASPCISPGGRWVLFVFSDGVEDGLGLVDIHGAENPHQLVRRSGFFMQPAWHPDGERLAWVEWDHPNMPWEGARLILGRLAGSPPALESQVLIAGDSKTPVSQPLFSPDGRWLSYIRPNGDWEEMLLFDLESGLSKTLVTGEGLLLSTPAWVQGMRFYGWSSDSRRLWYLANYGGAAAFSLWQVEVEGGEPRQLDTHPYTWLSQLSISPLDGQPAMLASAPSTPSQVVRWDGRGMVVECSSDLEDIPPAYLPSPHTVTWSAPDGSPVYGLYSPPSNPAYEYPGLPPAIINIHSGPTVQVPLRYHAETAYFTSRGYAWLDVNYRGSSGFGRAYMQKLNGGWGVIDVEDAAGAALALTGQKLADPRRLVLRGSSAGGYTVLNTLIRYPGLFKAGICLYGVSNLFTLAQKTHKFEAHYHETLVGRLPEAAGLYYERSPGLHAEKIRDPLLLFHGSDDRAVPLEQAEQIASALLKSGTPFIFKKYEGEGHGFRKTETIQDVLAVTEEFLQKHVLFP